MSPALSDSVVKKSPHIPRLPPTDDENEIQFEIKWNYPFEGPSRGRRYLLVCQRGVLSEQLREVRDSGTSSGVDPFLLYRIQLLERGGRWSSDVHTHRRNTPHCPHPVVGSFDNAEAANL